MLEALERYEDKGVLLYNLACAEAMLGEADEALAHLRQAIESQPCPSGRARTLISRRSATTHGSRSS